MYFLYFHLIPNKKNTTKKEKNVFCSFFYHFAFYIVVSKMTDEN